MDQPRPSKEGGKHRRKETCSRRCAQEKQRGRSLEKVVVVGRQGWVKRRIARTLVVKESGESTDRSFPAVLDARRGVAVAVALLEFLLTFRGAGLIGRRCGCNAAGRRFGEEAGVDEVAPCFVKDVAWHL
jgi:hypothetical protein